MKLKNIKTGTKLFVSFGFIIILTISIATVSFFSLNEIEEKSYNYQTVITAQKDFLIAHSLMESYLNEKDSSQYLMCSKYIDSSIHSFVELKPRLSGEDLPLIDSIFIKIGRYKELMQQNQDAITKQNEIYGSRRKMRIIYTEEARKNNISRDHDINYYFNKARLYAVYLLSSNDLIYYNEAKYNVSLALKEAYKINNHSIIKALDDYMVSVNENYVLALKIKETKRAQTILGKDILVMSGKMINHIDIYQEKVRKSTKVFMSVFSIISIVISILISRMIIVYMTRKQLIIEQKNKKLIEQANSLHAINALLEERQQQVEEQSEELTAQRDQLSQLNATKDKLFSILAHDLRSPFNSILGFSDLLLKNIRNYSIDKIETQLRYIRDSTRYTFDLLDNLLQWSRSQRGIIAFEPEILKISEYVNQELKNLRQQALRKDITIELVIEGDEKIVEADPNLINTVIRNLTSNAIKFSKKESKIILTLHFNDETFRFSVKDQGVGIPEDKRIKLFHVIENASSRGTDGEKGTGLGLLLCADFIQKHHGIIGVESEENMGSTFYFSIPYVQEN